MPRGLSPAERAHMDSCVECQAALQNLREFEALLRTAESWIGVTEAAPPAEPDDLRAFAVRMAEEDEEALLLLDDFREPSAAPRFVYLNIADKPEYQTGGVARLLCRWANSMCDRDPLYALKLAEAATMISQMLPDHSYPRNTIHDLRGEALKEQANAYLFLGRLPEAMRAVNVAESEYRKLSQENAGLAAVQYIRAMIHYEQGDLDAAERTALDAAEAARRLGAEDRYMRARDLLGDVLYDRHHYAAAAAVFEDILEYGQNKGSMTWVAKESLAVGICYTELRRTAEAERHLAESVRLFTTLGAKPEVTRAQWAVARLLFVQGHPAEAMHRLRRCIAEFTERQMITDAALASVDLAEIMNAANRTRDIPKVLAKVTEVFVNAGKLTSALTALAYLRDAASSGPVTPDMVAYVRRFVQRAERQPELLFAPPPPEPV